MEISHHTLICSLVSSLIRFTGEYQYNHVTQNEKNDDWVLANPWTHKQGDYARENELALDAALALLVSLRNVRQSIITTNTRKPHLRLPQFDNKVAQQRSVNCSSGLLTWSYTTTTHSCNHAFSPKKLRSLYWKTGVPYARKDRTNRH